MDFLFGEIRNLVKKINRVSNGQAKIVEMGDFMDIIHIEISPNDGLYKGASFLFKIRVDPYQKTESPTVFCMTPIYHPNIDTSDLEDLLPVDDNDFSTNACLNMFDNWQPGYGLDGMINGLLFLFYHPEIDDPLSPYISPGMSYEEFSENVHRSLLGEEVDGFFFERNLCDKQYEILRKQVDDLSELKIENQDPALPSAESAKESPLKDSEMVLLPNVEITMVPNTDSETMMTNTDSEKMVVRSENSETLVVRSEDSETLVVRSEDSETLVVSSEDSEAAILSSEDNTTANQDNETAVVSNEAACLSSDENKNLLTKEASNAKTKIFHNFHDEKDFCSIKSFDRTFPESDFIHAMVDKFLRRFFCCHSDNMPND